jgi:hypothetical protein
MNRFHFPISDHREELLGRLKFGADWIGLQSERELSLLNSHFFPPIQYSPISGVGPESRPPAIETWEYSGPAELREETSAAFERAIKLKKQLEWVREALRLWDKYGDRRKDDGSVDFERLDPYDDQDLLREARCLIAKPAAPIVDAAPLVRIIHHQKAASVGKGAGKRGPKPRTRERISRQMLLELRSDETTVEKLKDMSGPSLERVYKAHRDVCKNARILALAEFQSRQITPISK